MGSPCRLSTKICESPCCSRSGKILLQEFTDGCSAWMGAENLQGIVRELIDCQSCKRTVCILLGITWIVE